MTEFNVGDRVVRVSEFHTFIGASLGDHECAKGDIGTVTRGASPILKSINVKWDKTGKISALDPDNVELLPIIKVQDRVQVKTGAEGFHESWYGVPGRLFDSPVDFEDEIDQNYPYILMFDEDDRQYVYIKNLSDLEPVPDPEPTDSDDEELEKFVFVLTKDDVVEKFSLNDVYPSVESGNLYLYDNTTNELRGFFPEGKFEYFRVDSED